MHTWIGHSISYFFLLFQGCQAVKLSIVNTGCGRPNGALKLDVPRANPKECLQRCNKTNVGIQNANCYCGDFATAAVPNFNCAQQCKWEEAGINFACGGHQFSLYSRAGFVKKPKSKGRYLLEPLSGANIKEGMTDQSGCVLMKSDNEFRVENCSRKYSCWCDGDYFKSMEVTHTETNWAQCAQSCLDKYNMFGFTEGRDHCVQIPCDIDRWINAYVYNDCSPNPCQNNGTCTNTDVGFNCSCPPGFKGNTCEQGCFNILDATLDSFVQPSNFETYSLSPSSTLHSTLIIDISADQSSSVIARICSQSASSDLCFMSTVNYTASTITNSIHFSVTPTQTGSINLPSSVLASSSATGITIPSPAVLISTVTIYSSSSSTTSSSVSSTKTLTTASTSTSLESAINPTASIGPKSTFKTYSSGPSSTSTPSLTSVFSTVSAASTPTEPVYLSVSITASSSMRSTAMPPAAVPTPTGTIVSSSSITTSSSVTGTSVTPTAVPTPTGIIVLSSSITTSSSVTGTTVIPTETSNQSDAVTGWLSEHAVIIFPICGTVVILLVLIIIIICVKMRKMKRKNDELESEIMDTPSNSEFDYQTSFSYSQRPDNLYPSYHSGQYTYKEVPKLSPSQQIYLPRVSIKPAGSFPRRNKGYEDHSM